LTWWRFTPRTVTCSPRSCPLCRNGRDEYGGGLENRSQRISQFKARSESLLSGRTDAARPPAVPAQKQDQIVADGHCGGLRAPLPRSPSWSNTPGQAVARNHISVTYVLFFITPRQRLATQQRPVLPPRRTGRCCLLPFHEGTAAGMVWQLGEALGPPKVNSDCPGALIAPKESNVSRFNQRNVVAAVALAGRAV
jgi:hypothetical protein